LEGILIQLQLDKSTIFTHVLCSSKFQISRAIDLTIRNQICHVLDQSSNFTR